MPLMDHFRPPLSTQRHWEPFHAAWAGALADSLNEQLLTEGYFAEDRHEHRQAFATRCANYLYQGISPAIVDIVTTRQANLHDELIRLVGTDSKYCLPPGTSLYTVADRPTRRGDDDRIDLWPSLLKLGEKLPVVPLAISRDCSAPVDLEATYSDACRRRRLA